MRRCFCMPLAQSSISNRQSPRSPFFRKPYFRPSCHFDNSRLLFSCLLSPGLRRRGVLAMKRPAIFPLGADPAIDRGGKSNEGTDRYAVCTRGSSQPRGVLSCSYLSCAFRSSSCLSPPSRSLFASRPSLSPTASRSQCAVSM